MNTLSGKPLARIWDIPLLLSLGIIWASAFAMIKVAVAEVMPFTIVVARCGIGAAVMFAVIAVMGRTRWPVGARQWVWLVLTGIVSTAGPFWLIAFAEQKITSSMTGVLMTPGPTIAIVLGHFFTDDEKINRGKLLGVGIGFIGAVFLLREGVRDIGVGNLAYPLAVVAATFFYAVGGLMAKRLPHVSSEAIAAIVLASSALVIFPVMLVAEGIPDIGAVSTGVRGALLWLGVLPSGAAFYIRYFLIKRAGYGFVSYVGYLIPVFAIIIGNLWLGEVVTLETVVITMVILLGLMLTRGRRDFPWNLTRRMMWFRLKLK